MSTITIPSQSLEAQSLEARSVERTSTVGAIGGLVFTATILVQNALRASAPTNDASPEDIIRYYADHRGTALALAVLFVFGAAGLATFVGTLVARARGSARGAALVGALGAGAVIAMFGIVSATELALSTYAHRGAPDPSVVSAMWLTHMSVFGVNLTFIGVALAGLASACVAMGLLPKGFRTAAFVGAAALAVGGACTPAILDASPVFGIAVAGFAVWGVFLVVTAISLLRHAASD